VAWPVFAQLALIAIGICAITGLGLGIGGWNKFGLNETYLASTLELGDNLAICAAPENEENVEFYILMCTKKPFVCTKGFKCIWGQTFKVGDSVIKDNILPKAWE
jgi:hypothetical protein